ncbi:MAG: hypothetical protein ACI4C1_05765 [Lachnospiraceae bacterium]
MEKKDLEMMDSESKKKESWHEPRMLDWQDRVKDVLGTIVFFAAAFGYWMLVLLIISFIFVNIWMVTIEELIQYALVLMTISGIVYIVLLYRKRKKQAEIMERLRG